MFDRSLAASLAALCLTTAIAVPALADDAPAAPTVPAPAAAQDLRDRARTAMTSGDVAGASRGGDHANSVSGSKQKLLFLHRKFIGPY